MWVQLQVEGRGGRRGGSAEACGAETAVVAKGGTTTGVPTEVIHYMLFLGFAKLLKYTRLECKHTTFCSFGLSTTFFRELSRRTLRTSLRHTRRYS